VVDRPQVSERGDAFFGRCVAHSTNVEGMEDVQGETGAGTKV
jgi:hypothetical protein